jgi:hypothetical protein
MTIKNLELANPFNKKNFIKHKSLQGSKNDKTQLQNSKKIQKIHKKV